MQGCLRIIILGAMLIASGARANDSIGREGIGGLELLKTDDIQMVSEVLEISTSKIRVTYHFLNTSDHDIKATVAFPMPPFGDMSEYPEDTREGPLDSFRLFVDGAPIKIKMNRVFQVDNTNVTDKLRNLGFSDKQIFDHQFKCISASYFAPDVPGDEKCMLTPKQKQAAKRLMNVNYYAAKIQETAYWEQVFPAGREIEVIHEYKPRIGGHMGTDLFLLEKETHNEACLDDKTRRTLIKKLKGNDERRPNFFWGYDLEYILGTGRNWKGPIKNFRLVIKKDSPEEIISLCFPGKPVKTSPTTIEFTQTDYVPQDKLVVYFYDIRY